MGHGPEMERIEGGDYPTARVEIERQDGRRETVEGLELLDQGDAMREARKVWQQRKHDPDVLRVRVVNERTGFTCDEISRG